MLSGFFFLFAVLSCSGNQKVGDSDPNKKTDGWIFTVEVGIEKKTADAVGGFEEAKKIVKTQFETINNKFNSPKVFKSKICFKVSSFFEFEGKSTDYCFSGHPCCDIRMVINGFCADDDAGGGWYSGNIKCIHHRWNMDHKGGTFGQAATDGITHEFGHVRGAIDIYALKVDKEKNPVNHTVYEGVKGIMNACYGESVWDSHSISMINRSVDSINPPDLRNLFPKKIGIKVVDENGLPHSGCSIKLFPVAWYSYTVQDKAAKEGVTGNTGELYFSENPFDPTTGDEYPWNIKYCNFLVEASNGGKTSYAWMPIDNVQNAFFNGGDFTLVIKL